MSWNYTQNSNHVKTALKGFVLSWLKVQVSFVNSAFLKAFDHYSECTFLLSKSFKPLSAENEYALRDKLKYVWAHLI